MSVMQGKVRVDLLGDIDPPRQREHSVRSTPSNVTSPVSSWVTILQSRVSQAQSRFVAWHVSSRFTQHLDSKSALPLVLIVLVLGCVCMGLLMVFFQGTQVSGTKWGDEGRAFEAQPQSLGSQRFTPLLPDRRATPVSASLTPLLPRLSPVQPVSMHSLAAFSDVAEKPSVFPGQQPSPLPTQPPADHPPFSEQAPPPLCPTLVLRMCEARFGVPLHDLAHLGSEGDIAIVGLSGNPLLRAAVRLDSRRKPTLEIRMPEKNSAPRATLVMAEASGQGQRLTGASAGYPYNGGRPSMGMASPQVSRASLMEPALQSGARAMEIRGMKNNFYGMLEMRQTGSCYVIKDGLTVLVIDGNTANLQLFVKSGAGCSLATVRCSSEPFGGVDHVEIRVEPGVDTVLILAVVLGVLLLSS